ncbi:DUF6634 family protein [Microvirga subterranea]|uniref:Uncharacterized protein n=1 Tax=Microvirga subterranea TaxID=186651 RepID=A0A370HM18_9HYPH|nr:DUF6634 family protein [Microvirga subterranea]RDI57226.1 hypothetical protein DES45_107143 [Microvirga subterranea]
MFVIHKDRILSRDNVAALIIALEQFIPVLRAIQEGHGPTVQELAEAPVLNNWSLEVKSAPCLRVMTDFTDDLLLPYGQTLGELLDFWIIAEQQGWVRGLLRWYRLGTPLGPFSPS